MPQCAAFNCTRASHKHEKDALGVLYSFHRFPKQNDILLRQWLHNLGRADFAPAKTSVLCSAHFTSDCFLPDRLGTYMWRSANTVGRRLIDGAVPTEFSHRHTGAGVDFVEGTATGSSTPTATAASSTSRPSMSQNAKTARNARARKRDRERQLEEVSN